MLQYFESITIIWSYCNNVCNTLLIHVTILYYLDLLTVTLWKYCNHLKVLQYNLQYFANIYCNTVNISYTYCIPLKALQYFQNLKYQRLEYVLQCCYNLLQFFHDFVILLAFLLGFTNTYWNTLRNINTFAYFDSIAILKKYCNPFCITFPIGNKYYYTC